MRKARSRAGLEEMIFIGYTFDSPYRIPDGISICFTRLNDALFSHCRTLMMKNENKKSMTLVTLICTCTRANQLSAFIGNYV